MVKGFLLICKLIFDKFIGIDNK